MIHWHQLNNLYGGCTAVLIGRGPTLDAWLEAGQPLPSRNFVTIGVNSICLLRHIDFSVSADADADRWIGPATQWVRGVPFRDHEGKETWKLPDSATALHFHHSEHAPAGRALRLAQSREQLAASRRLCCASSSAHPAIHLAWYLGCSSVITVGIDGSGGRALATQPSPGKPPPPDEQYGKMLHESRVLLDRLFPDAWEKWVSPLPQP